MRNCSLSGTKPLRISPAPEKSAKPIDQSPTLIEARTAMQHINVAAAPVRRDAGENLVDGALFASSACRKVRRGKPAATEDFSIADLTKLLLGARTRNKALGVRGGDLQGG